MREYICTKETFLKMKADQIEMTHQRRTEMYLKDYNEKYAEWIKLAPTEVKRFLDETCPTCHHTKHGPNPDYNQYLILYKDWKSKAPDYPASLYTKERARLLNILYGIVRGKKYYQIEQKIRDDNHVNFWGLERMAESYGIAWELVSKELVNNG